MYEDAGPVHEDDETAKSWITDELTWSDVYSKKPVEYLEAIARGETPRWDSDKGGYSYGNSDESEISMGGTSEKQPTIDPQSGDQPDEDLPF